MKAVVLVGGEGTRLRPLTSTIPKPLLPIANQPFLERQLTWLAQHGIDEAVLSLGYLQHAFVEHFPDGEYRGVQLRYAVEPVPLGTAGAIRFAAESAGIDERFLVCNGDVLTDLDVSGLVAFHSRHGGEATIALTEVEDPSAFGVVPTFADGEVAAFVEKPTRERAPTRWINAGTYVLEPAILERVPPRLQVSIERETFPRLLESGRGRMYAQASDAYWLDIGTPSKYLEAHHDLVRGRLGTPAPGAVEATPGVWTQGAVSLDGAVDAPTLIGERARVEAGAEVRDSVLGPDCVVEAGARVSGSVVLYGARVGAGAQVVDSIVGPGAVLEPGVAVRDGSIVGPGAVVGSGTQLTAERVDAAGATL